MRGPSRMGRPSRPESQGKCLRRVPYTEADWLLAVNLGERIAEVRQEQDVSQDELAAAVGVDVSNVSKWEVGKRLCPTRRLYQIAQALGVRMGDLMPEHL